MYIASCTLPHPTVILTHPTVILKGPLKLTPQPWFKLLGLTGMISKCKKSFLGCTQLCFIFSPLFSFSSFRGKVKFVRLRELLKFSLSASGIFLLTGRVILGKAKSSHPSYATLVSLIDISDLMAPRLKLDTSTHTGKSSRLCI